MVEHAHRHHWPPLDLQIQPAKLVDCPTEPAELSREERLIRRARLGLSQAIARFHHRRTTDRGPSGETERLACDGDDLDIQIHLPVGRPFERAAQSARQLGIVGLPDRLADRKPAQIDRLSSEPKFDAAREFRLPIDLRAVLRSPVERDDLVEPATLLVATG